MQEMQNLYEVRKTVRFELKPSKITQLNLEKQDLYKNPINILYKNKLEKWFNYSRQIFEDDLKDTLKTIKNISINLDKIKNLLNNLTLNEIYIDRKIYELIDKNYYIKSVKKKLSWWRSSNFYEIKKNLDWEWINFIRNYYSNNLEIISNLIIDIEIIWKKETSFSKNQIKKILRKLSLELIRIFNFLQFFDTKNKNSSSQFKEYIEKVTNLEIFFEEIKSYYFISENQSSWILMRRLWFNERSLKRRQTKDIKDELEKNKNEFDEKNNNKQKLENERQKIVEDFDSKLKKTNYPNLLHPEKWQDIKRKIEQTQEEKIFLLQIENNFKELKAERNNDENIKEVTNELNSIKKQVWNLKVKINNLEKELENNLALSHYTKLLKKNNDWEMLYYLVLIPTENKNLLEQYIWDDWDTNILEYNTLTFNALEKLCLKEDWTMGWYFDKNLKLYILKNQPDKKILKIWSDYKLFWDGWDFYNKKFNEKYSNYEKSSFDKLKKYIQDIILNNNNIFLNINFDFVTLYKQNNIDDYIKEFNKQWYNIFWKNIEFWILEDLEKKWEVELYQIYTKDFYRDKNFFDINYSILEQKEERTKRRKEENVNWNKNLFTIYWEKFIKDIVNWSENIRLNSDCWYYIKLIDKDIDKEQEWKSRKKRNKIVCSFNLIFNSNKTLTKTFDEKENIEEFNNIYKNNVIKDIQNLTFIWLDRWEKELLTYCLIDNNWNCIKDENWGYIIWDFNYINSKWEFKKKEDCLYKDKNWKIFNDLIWTFLPDFSHSENIIEWKKKFQKDENWYFFKLNHDAKFYLLEWEEKRYKIINKNWEELILQDKDWNKVINYYLVFQSEVYKRYILNKTWNIILEDIQELRGWYISNIIKKLNDWIIKYNWVLVLENLDKIQKDIDWKTNKEKMQEKTFWSTIYQEIETLLNKKYNYFIYKDTDFMELQLTPKIKNIWDIKKLEKSSENVNLWDLIFIDEYKTSKICPNINCLNQLHRPKDLNDNIYHNENNIWKNWCIFDTWKIKREVYGFSFIKSWDDLAAYNIAKKWLKYIKSFDKTIWIE